MWGVCMVWGMDVSMGCGEGYINRADVTKLLLPQGKITRSSMEYMYTPIEETKFVLTEFFYLIES